MEQEGKQTKTSRVRQVIFKRDGNNEKGYWAIFEISFDNGDKGNFFTKSNPQTDFKYGEEIEYVIEKKMNGNFLNTNIYLPKKSGIKGKSFNPISSNKQCALTNAVNLHIAGKIEKEAIYKTADKLFSWLQGESKSTEQ